MRCMDHGGRDGYDVWIMVGEMDALYGSWGEMDAIYE